LNCTIVWRLVYRSCLENRKSHCSPRPQNFDKANCARGMKVCSGICFLANSKFLGRIRGLLNHATASDSFFYHARCQKESNPELHNPRQQNDHFSVYVSFLTHRRYLGACGGLKKDLMSENGYFYREGLDF
jgi:hypothetical protein